MYWYNWAQLTAFAIVIAIAWKTPRASLWAAALAASYVLSVAYIRVAPATGSWPPSQLVGLLLDGAVLVLIREHHREKWEYYGLCTIMSFMVTADIVQLFGVLTGFPPPLTQVNFGVILEALNYMALALIGGIGLMDLVPRNDRYSVAHHRFSLLHRTRRYAHARTHEPQPLRKW